MFHWQILRAKGFKEMGRRSPAGEARWCSRRSGRGWRHRGPGSRSRGVDAGRAAASSVARARGRQALKRAIIYLTQCEIGIILISMETAAPLSDPQTLIEAIRYFADPDVTLR